MTRLGLGSYGVGWSIGVPGYEPPPDPLDVFGLVRLTADLGLKLVQIADNLPLHRLSEAERTRLRALADQLGISIEVGTRGIQPDHLQQYLAWAQDFRSPILRVVVDTADSHPSAQEVVELLRPQLADFETAGITLAIENHDRFKAQTLADIIAALDHPRVGICLDTVNSFGALEGSEIVVQTLGRYVVNLHVKEFVIQRMPHNMGFIVTGAPAGRGMLNVRWLLDALHGYGRKFNAIIETWLSPAATMAETVQQEQAWVRESVRYLREMIKD